MIGAGDTTADGWEMVRMPTMTRLTLPMHPRRQGVIWLCLVLLLTGAACSTGADELDTTGDQGLHEDEEAPAATTTTWPRGEIQVSYTINYSGLEQGVASADLIAIAAVAEVDVRIQGRYMRLEVEESLRGTPDDEVWYWDLSKESDEGHQWWAEGYPWLEVGDRALFVLSQNPDSLMYAPLAPGSVVQLERAPGSGQLVAIDLGQIGG